MTDQEFSNLMIGTILSNKRGELYRVTQKYDPQVYRADSIDTSRKTAVKITESNCRYWTVSEESVNVVEPVDQND